jgi:hypothetical protein
MDCARFEHCLSGDPFGIEWSPRANRASSLSELRLNDGSVAIAEKDRCVERAT